MNETWINDVPSPIDLRLYEDALEWQEQANVKRLWRKDFFDYYVSLINKKLTDVMYWNWVQDQAF